MDIVLRIIVKELDFLALLNIKLFLCLTIIILHIYLAFKLKHDLHMLQQNSYRNERYRRWHSQHRAAEGLWLALSPGLVVLAYGWLISLLAIAFQLKHSSVWFVGLLFIMVINCYILVRYLHRTPVKKPLIMTARAKRLYGTALAVSFLWPLCLIYEYTPFQTLFYYSYITLPVYSGYYLLFINWLLQPLEKRVNRKYLNEAKQILAKRPALMRVAITGSYGKTSCKMILAAMLSERYITLATPESVNTPMGITRVIREQLKPIHQVFICEMGAKQAGDIAELCALAQPQTGLLTAIGPQHLETFGSEEAIAETKFELIRALPPQGLAVLNLGNEAIAARQGQAPCRAVGYGLAASLPYHAEDIRYSAQGACFTLVTPLGGRQPVISRLLGRHNIENIVGAAAVAVELGLSLPQIARAVRSLNPLPHRLQLMAGPGYTIIDDAFNANPAGAAAALSVLAQLGEGQKILITPGLVELGEKQRELNREFARLAAGLCDFIILVGKKHSQPLQEGLQEAAFPAERYALAAGLAEARQMLARRVRPGDTVLFENDLPDTYTEVTK
jgi:UDP-N-acetylmuramoyl-tripeptide--D-alanyl-D-alanine ligase